MPNMLSQKPEPETILQVVGLVPAAEIVRQTSGTSLTLPPAGATIRQQNKCVVCSAVFGREDELIQHLNAHVDGIRNKMPRPPKPADHRCTLCLQAFGYDGLLKRHMQTHHCREKPFDCSICRCRYFTKGRMLRHKISKHAEMTKIH